MYFIDIAVPRNVEPAAHNIDNVYVYNIDDLRSLVEESLARRKAEISRADRLINDWASEFSNWMSSSARGGYAALKHYRKDRDPVSQR